MMLGKDVAMAIRAMRANRGRSFFTMLGIIIAVASVTSVVSIGRGIQSAINMQANQYSKNVVTVRPAQISSAAGPLGRLAPGNALASLTNKDVSSIQKVPHVESGVPLTIVGSSATADSSFNGIVFAVSSELPEVINQELAFGSYFTSKEDSNSVAVLGATAADKLFDQRVPLGRTFTIRGHQFIVSGVLTKFASTPFVTGTNFNDAIFVPSSAIKTLTPNGAPMYEILAKVDSDKHVSGADAAITKSLAKNHGGSSDFEVLSPSELSRDSTQTFELLEQLVLAAAIITLLVSGVGIMNVMLVSITERMHEVGIRKAVGATNRQILGQFMTEAATLSVIGSIIGAAAAFGLVWFLRIFTGLSPIYDWKTAGIACAISCGFGILFGSIPALKAARKDPIEALRSQ